jgi:peptide/nickel transport system substrate-binding protein
VTLSLGTPFADAVWGFSDFFPGRRTSIICPAGLAALKANPKALDTPTTTYGTGPYTVADAVPGGDVTLKLRPEFAWGPNGITAKTAGMPGTMKYLIQNNATTVANLVKSGQVNLSVVTGADVARLAADTSLAHKAITAGGVNPMYLNHAAGHVTSDVKVRQALITAIDPKLYLKALQQPGELSTSIVPKSMSCYDPQTEKLAPTPSVAAATKILTDDGWVMKDGKLSKNGQPLALEFPARSGFGSAAEYMANAFEQMGATVHLTQVDNGTWISQYTAGKFDVTVLNNVLDPPTVALASTSYASAPPPAGTNYSSVTNWQDYQKLVGQAEATTGDQACAPMRELQQSLWKNWDALPLYAPVTDFFGNNVDLANFANRNLSIFGITQLG